MNPGDGKEPKDSFDPNIQSQVRPLQSSLSRPTLHSQWEVFEFFDCNRLPVVFGSRSGVCILVDVLLVGLDLDSEVGCVDR